MEPSSPAFPPCDGALASRTLSIACRLLSGAGSATLVVYEWAPSTTMASLVHGMSSRGQFVVAACPAANHPGGTFPDSLPVDVRLSILKDAADPAVRINSASVHALGTFEWVSSSETTRMLLDDELPPHVAAIAASENGRLGIVRSRRFLVHDSCGITPVMLADLERCLVGVSAVIPFPTIDDELDANHAVLACGQDALCRMCDAVTCGRLPGRELTRRPLRSGCVRFGDQVFCADVDRTGMVLVRIGPDATETVFAPFPDEVTSITDLTEQLDDLTRDSVPLELPQPQV